MVFGRVTNWIAISELLIRRSESAELGGFQLEDTEFEVIPESFLSTRSRALPLPPTPQKAFAAKPREVENDNRECFGGEPSPESGRS